MIQIIIIKIYMSIRVLIKIVVKRKSGFNLKYLVNQKILNF